jgi:hypothetical protein
MIAGIPGTGIGGLFYLLIALWMLFRELYLRIREKGSLERWRIVKGHIFITLWIIMGMWATGEFIGFILITIFPKLTSKGISNNILHITPFLFTLATLISVYLCVHILSFCVVKIDKK